VLDIVATFHRTNRGEEKSYRDSRSWETAPLCAASLQARAAEEFRYCGENG